MYKKIYIIESFVKKAFRKAKTFVLRIRGANIGHCHLSHNARFTWPHKVKIGDDCIIEHNVFFKHDGPYEPGVSIEIGKDVFIGSGCEFNIKEKIEIGDHSLIASGCRFIDHDHGTEDLNKLMNSQKGPVEKIRIENNVWIGANSVILKGVKVESGAVIGAGSIVNKNVPKNEIWAGVPVRKVGTREESLD